MRWILASLVAFAALSGCLSDDEPQTNDDTPDESMDDQPMESNLTTEYSWDSGLGCAGETLPDPCIAYQTGPGGEGPDGYWIPLGADYVGMMLGGSVENVRGDSDCYFTDADGAVIGDANNGALECAGAVPAGAEWVFVYSYAEPHQGLVITFS